MLRHQEDWGRGLYGKDLWESLEEDLRLILWGAQVRRMEAAVGVIEDVNGHRKYILRFLVLWVLLSISIDG